MNNQISITLYDGRVAHVESREDVNVVIFNYGNVKKNKFSKKKFDIISIENHHVEGKGDDAIVGVSDEI